MPSKLASRVRGLSEAQFREAYGTEEQCRAVVEKLRWPKGFVCPLCGGTEGRWLSTRPKIQCRTCRHQVSLTAGTIFHATKLPLTSWFLAMWLIATAKNGISSVELGRRLGIKQTNGWALKQKIMAAMTARENAKRLDGRVEMDDVYLGGHRPGKRGRGAAGKQPVVAAVSTSDDRRPRKIKLLPVKGFRKKEVKRLVSEHLASTSRLVTDGLRCWTAAAGVGLHHTAMVTGSGRPAAQWSPFKWVNTTLGNVKAAITGTYRRISPEHAGRYLGSFAWRHNRRFQLDSLVPRLVHSAVRTDPMPYATLIAS
jgi:ISXO2-like transposase domain/Transposase zinc-ribbon domain